VRGNISLKHRDRYCERKISEVIKKIDSMKNLEEYLQNKYGEKWLIIDIEAREGFSNSTTSKIKCAAGLNMYGERIKLIDKKNRHAVCPTCNEIETWEHVMLCEKQKEKRAEWVQKLKTQFDVILKKRKATAYEINIVREMENDIVKYFNKEENFWTNQQVLGMRDVFRGIVVRDWGALPIECIDFTPYNKVMIKKAVDFYSACWNNRCVVMHSPEVRKQYLRKELKAIKLEAMSGTIENYNRYVKAYPINEETASLESMSMWIKKARVFRNNTKRSGQQDIRNLLLMS